MIRTLVTLLAVASLFSGCAMTLPVRGQATTGGEVFTGTATGYMDGGGTLKVVSNRGRACTGDFVYVNNREGAGTFVCDDGNSGPFQFVSTGTRGTGTGMIGGEQFTFSFG